MNKQQYDQIATIIRGDLSDDDKINEVNKVLGIDIADQSQAVSLKDKITGKESMIVTNEADGSVKVGFGGVEVHGKKFGIAYIATLLNVIANRSLEKFLPQAKPEPATGSRDGAAASPAGVRALPAGINRG